MIQPGNVCIQTHNAATGQLLTHDLVKNKWLAGGRNIVRDLLANGGWPPNYIAVGQDSTAVSDADPALGQEVFRNALTRTVRYASKVSYQVYILDTQANGYTLREIGLFSGTQRYYTTEAGGTPLYGGTLCARALITPIVKTSAITVTITWEIPIQSAS